MRWELWCLNLRGWGPAFNPDLDLIVRRNEVAVMKLSDFNTVTTPFCDFVDRNAGRYLERGEGSAEIVEGALDPELHGEPFEASAEIESVSMAFSAKLVAGDHEW